MTVAALTTPFPYFTTAAGQPLEAGYVYIGDPGYEARSKPKASFWDAAATIPTGTAGGGALRTTGGYPTYAGTAARVYIDGDYSITVLNSAGVLVFSTLSAGMTLNDAGAIAEVEALINNFSNTLNSIDARLDEYQQTAADWWQPARKLMTPGDSYILASDDNRRTLHYCVTPGTYRIDVSGIQFGAPYTITAGPTETVKVYLESGPGLTFMGGSAGRLGLNATGWELQSGETVTLTKMRTNEIVILSSQANPDVYSFTTGSPSVDTLFEQQADGRYMLTHTRTLNASQVVTTTPPHPTRTMDFTNAVLSGSVIINGAANTQIPFTLAAPAAGASITIVNPNAATARGTIVIRNIDWSYT